MITAHTPLRQNCGVPVPASLDSSLQVTLFHLANDVCTAGMACASATDPQIDLVGGTHLVDYVFRDGFD